MARINKEGYIERRERSYKKSNAAGSWRDWWLVKFNSKYSGMIMIKGIYIPARYVGKKVRFRIEVSK